MIPANLCFNHGTRQGTKSERKICGIPDGIGIPANFAGIHFFGIFRRNFSEWIGINFFEKIPPE